MHVPVGLNCDQMEPPHEEQHSQYPVERNPNAYRSMSDYRNPPWMSTPSCIVPPKNAPYGNAYNPSWGNHLNLSWGTKPLQYAPPTHSQYASSSQPQPPQSTSPVEQAILNLSKLVGNFLEKQKTINAQLRQKIDTMENNVDFKAKLIRNLTTHRNQFQGLPISNMFLQRKRIQRKSA